MFGSHWIWLGLLVVVVLIIFGPGRLPELGGAVGKAMREFRKATTELTNEVKSSVEAQPQPTAPVAPATPPVASTSSSSDGTTTTSS
jgi:sec-independent protein translocase protein TatA